MSTDVTLPALGESVTEGTVSRWLKQVGDTVEADEPLLEVSTDKVDTEIPSPVAGVLLEIRADEDETVEVGAVLAVVGEADEAQPGGGDADGGSDSAQAPSAEDQSSGDTTQPDDEASADRVEAAADEPDPAPSSGGSGGAGGGEGTEVTLPALGESVTEGTVSRWLKAVGDSVEADEPLLEVSTDKVDTEIPSPTAGTLLEIRVQEDETVEVGAVLAVVGEAGASGGGDTGSQDAGRDDTDSTPVEEQADDGDEGGQAPMPAPEPKAESKSEPKAESKAEAKAESKSEPKAESKPEPKGESAPAAAPRASGGADDTTYVTPLVRKLAAEHSVDLSSLTGTGVGGRIRKQDVLAAADEAKKAAAEAEKAPAPAASAPAASAPAASSAPAPQAEPSALRGTTEKISRMRKTIAARMVESLQVSAQLTATVEVDLTAISRLRAAAKDDFKKREGASLSYLPFITKAAIEALKVYPKVNATIDTEAGVITYPDAEHVSVAVDTERGLMVPVIKDAGDLNLAGLAKKIADLAARTRSNKIGPDELTGGTFTITNYGSAGTLMDTPIINQPQVAILGTGALVKRPVVIKDPNLGEVIAVRDMMYLSMSYDHRLVDGADAARFLSLVKARLEGGDFGAELGV
ncbi:MAG: 2-oxoglutarate dehydrogenase, E2 component, dihydrolipoamide succinyltransferase [Propionibacteriaceae bacterium]